MKGAPQGVANHDTTHAKVSPHVRAESVHNTRLQAAKGLHQTGSILVLVPVQPLQ